MWIYPCVTSVSLALARCVSNNKSVKSFYRFPLCELPFSCFTCLTWLHKKLYALRGDFLQMWLPFQWCEIGISDCEIVWSHVNQPWTNSFYPWNRFWQTTCAKIQVHTKLCFRTNITPNKIQLLQIPKTTMCEFMTQHTILFMDNEIELVACSCFVSFVFLFFSHLALSVLW